MNARTRDPDATRAAILDAAEEVFLEKGFGNTAMSAVAGRAGVTKSLIYHHFGSKDDLWREVKTRRFLPYAEQQQRMLDDAQPSPELLRRSIEAYFRFLKHNPQVVQILGWMFLERDAEECIHKDRQLIEIGVAKLEEAQRDGGLRADIDARFILFTFLGLAQHWFQDRQHFIRDFGADIPEQELDEAYLQAMVEIVLGGIVTQK